MNSRILGSILILIAATCWGTLGVSGEYLIGIRGVDAGWLATCRIFVGGSIMMIILIARNGRDAFRIWKNRRDAVSILLFAFFGVGCNIYFYMLSVKCTNSPTATTFQYLSPSLIVIYTALRTKKMPSAREIIAVLLALAGVFIISTHCRLTSLAITPVGLVIGLMSAVFLAFYGVFPQKLLHKYGAVYVFAWGQFSAGVMLNILRRPIWMIPSPEEVTFDLIAILVVCYQLTMGAVSYCIYLKGVTMIGPARASMISSIEPGATAVIASVLLATPLVFLDYVGMALITLCIIVLSVPMKKLHRQH